MPKKLDLTGKRYGQLTAICAAGRTTKAGSVIWKCRCDCGNEVEVSASDLNKGNNRSCGCLKEKSKKLVRDRLHIVDGACIEWLDERKGRHDNRSGCPGVYRKRNGKYTVNIGFKKKIYYLGSCDKYEKAAECRHRAEKMVHEGFLKAYQTWELKSEEEPGWGERNPFVYEVEKENGRLVVHNSMA